MGEPGMVSMFQALIASGLQGFLGCTAVVYEDALVEFFANGTVRDDLVVSTVTGVTIEISEKLFTETFDLPVDGFADTFEMPKEKIFDARSIVSLTGGPVTLSGLKSQMKMHYRLLCDIMEKSISVKAGSFNAITVEKFSLLTAEVCDVKMNWGSVLFGILKKMVTPGTKQAKGFAIQISLLLESVPNLELGESSEFPSSKILTDKTIHRYIAVIDKSGAQEPADAPKVKKAPKKKVASRKRPADIPSDVPVVKKKRTSKKKSTLEIVVVSQEAIPILSVPVSPAIEPMVEDQQAEFSKEQPADELPTDKSAASTEERHWFDLSYEELIAKWAAERPAPVDDPDTVINQVLQQMDSISADQCDTSIVKGAESLGVADQCDTSIVEGAESFDVGTAGGAQQVKFSEEELVEKSVDAFISVDETMSLDDILYSIPGEVSLPSTGVEVTKISFGKEIKIPGVTEFTWHLAGLPKIPADHKGKEPPIEKNQIKGNPVMEQVTLILADIDCLVQVRAKLVDEVAKFFYSFSFKRLANLQIDDSYFDKEELVLTWAESESTGIALQRRRYILLNYKEVLLRKFLEVRKMKFKPSEGSSAIDLKILDLLYDVDLFILEELKKEIQAHGLMWKKACCSKIFEGRPRDRGAVIARTNSNTPSKCWIRTMLRINGTLCDSLRDQADIFKNLSQGARQEARTIDDVQTLRFNEFRKNVLAQNSSIFTGLADVRKEVQEVNAKVDILASRLNGVQKNVEETKEALCHQLLEFQSQSQANQNILNAQLIELVNYINRGSADKKGKSSSRGPQPPDAQISASAERTPSFAQRVEMAQRRIVQTVLDADSNRESLERQAAAERDRERRRREARLLKRRRS
ncbi:hypothetical protein F511_17195 [Dorcoceras hygrometricum]|uniref:Dystroglycan-like n=1 Tax=Dorcoceras hygrometricum TaxID=472368 RepID=A0A2Z7BXK0_9LAMI|nr:hypothetical protein F511_17195 [Dorcoceras hygrometricum]